MTWVENDAGFLNLQRAQRITVKPRDGETGWEVVAHFGSYAHFVDAFDSRTEAAEFVAEILFGDDQ